MKPVTAQQMLKILYALVAAALTTISYAQMLISPTEEFHRSALALLDEHEKAQPEARFPRGIDISNASFGLPKSETSKRSTADIYRIDWAGFFEREHNGSASSHAIVIVKTTTLTRMQADTGNDTPKFVVEVEWKLREGGSVYTARGRGVGPTYVGHGRTTKNPEAIRSANIAFYAAFLRAMSQIAAQVQSEAPQPSAVPNEPPAKKKEGDANGLFGR